MYESSFIYLNLLRTNSIFGVFPQYQRFPSTFNSSFVLAGDGQVSLDFLPIKKAKIEACDSSQGILLCVDSMCFATTSYIVCKPTIRQYRTIPNPETGCPYDFRTIVSGLSVIGTNHFRYKIVKLSQQCKIASLENDHCYTLICEVFDSDLFAWKRLDSVNLPEGEFLQISSVPVSINGFLHWLTTPNKNVFRFCMRTETWSLLPLPNGLAKARSPVIANYKGKLGIILWKPKNGDNLKGTWALHSSFGKSWVNVKEDKSLVKENKSVKPVCFLPSSDVVMMAGFDWVSLYDMKPNSIKSGRFKNNPPYVFSYNGSSVNYFPFYSEYKRIDDFNEDDVE